MLGLGAAGRARGPDQGRREQLHLRARRADHQRRPHPLQVRAERRRRRLSDGDAAGPNPAGAGGAADGRHARRALDALLHRAAAPPLPRRGGHALPAHLRHQPDRLRRGLRQAAGARAAEQRVRLRRGRAAGARRARPPRAQQPQAARGGGGAARRGPADRRPGQAHRRRHAAGAHDRLPQLFDSRWAGLLTPLALRSSTRR